MQSDLRLSLIVTLTAVLTLAVVTEANPPPSLLHRSVFLNFAPSPLTNFTGTRTVSRPPRRYRSVRPPDPSIQPLSPVSSPRKFAVSPLMNPLIESSPRPSANPRWRSLSRPQSLHQPPSPSSLSPLVQPTRRQRRSRSNSVLSPPTQPSSAPPLTRSPRRPLPRSQFRRRRRRTPQTPPPPPPSPPRRSSYPRPLRPQHLSPPSPPPPTPLQPLSLPESEPTLSLPTSSPPAWLPKQDLTSSPLVPGLFVLGDSSVEAGTANYVGTIARADRLPYGRDFDTHEPTGRFCNGRLPVDFLARRLGLPFAPSYLRLNGSTRAMIHGVNYASAAAGVIYASGSELGQFTTFTQQIQQFSDTLQLFILDMGEKAASERISRSVFYISVGANDYIHYYLQNESSVQNLYLPWSFSQFIATAITRCIENLHNMYVRRVVVMGLGPMGCAPRYLWQYSSEDGGCIEEINNIAMEFNFIMRRKVEELNEQLRDIKIIFCDALEGSLEIIKNHQQYGFDVISDACCGLGKYNGWIMCMSPDMACGDARKHIWWDQFHPTDAVNAILADNIWNGFHSQMCYPMNLEDIVFDTS